MEVFNCRTFAYVSKEQRIKLDDKSVPCIFIGYEDEEFGYKLWDPVKKKVSRSRDVVFREREVRITDDLSKKGQVKEWYNTQPYYHSFYFKPSHKCRKYSRRGCRAEVAPPDKVVERGEQLDDHTEQVELPTQEE